MHWFALVHSKGQLTKVYHFTNRLEKLAIGSAL